MVQSETKPIDERVALRRREILHAASTLFRRRGLQRTGMRDIARALGVAVGQLYYYFENKEALLAYCQEVCLERLLAESATIRRAKSPASVRLSRLIEAHLRCLNEEIPGSLAHLEVESLNEPTKQRILRLRKKYEEALIALLKEGQADGTLVASDPVLTVRLLLGALNWSVKWFNRDGSATLDSLVQTAQAYLVPLTPRAPARRVSTSVSSS